MTPEEKQVTKGIVFSFLASALQDQHALVDNSHSERKRHYLSFDSGQLLSRHQVSLLVILNTIQNMKTPM